MIKVGNDSFHHTQFGPKASETMSQRRFLPKLKVCPSSISSKNPSAQNSKLENNASDNTSLLLMYRMYNLLFYSQFSCAIARFHFSNISVSFPLAFSMYFLSPNFFHQPQFDPNSSRLYFFEKVFIYVKERLFLK
jgi:hypothetical protein